jgi:hypothetical protein
LPPWPLSSAQVAAVVADIPYDAAPVFAALRDDLLPGFPTSLHRIAALPGRDGCANATRRFRQRPRAESGPIVSLLVFGTTFTKQP